MASVKISLSDEMKNWVEELRALLIEGENSGKSSEFDFEAFITSKKNSTKL